MTTPSTTPQSPEAPKSTPGGNTKTPGGFPLEARRSSGVSPGVFIIVMLLILGGIGAGLYYFINGFNASTSDTTASKPQAQVAEKAAQSKSAAELPVENGELPKGSGSALSWLNTLATVTDGLATGLIGEHSKPQEASSFENTLEPEKGDDVEHALDFPAADTLPQGEEQAPPAIENTDAGLKIGNIEIAVESDKVKVLFQGSEIYGSIVNDYAGEWFGIIRDPYSALVTSNGSPFFQGTNSSGQEPSDNMGKFTLNNSQLMPLTAQDLRLFPFFTSNATTIGFAHGIPGASEGAGNLYLYFIDTDSGQLISVEANQMAYPAWIMNDTYPPPFAVNSTAVLSDSFSAISAEVATDIKSFSAGEYQSDSAAYNSYASAEFSKAKLNKDELQHLATSNISDGSVTENDFIILAKLTKLLYYGKKLDKLPALQVLLEQVHPSIRAEIMSNPELRVETAVDSAAPIAPGTDLAGEYEKGRKAANSGSFSKALQIWQPLADQGYSKAQFSIGRMYARGDGVRQNFATARSWFEKAAQQGDDAALLGLGKLYLNGDGVPQSNAQALKYFSQAAAKGNAEARGFVEKLQG